MEISQLAEELGKVTKARSSTIGSGPLSFRKSSDKSRAKDTNDVVKKKSWKMPSLVRDSQL